MKLKRTDWKPTKYSAVCSKHILDYFVMFSGLTTFEFKESFGRMILGFRSTQLVKRISIESKPAESKRSERKVRTYAFTQIYVL